MKGYYEIEPRHIEPQWETAVFSCYSFDDIRFHSSTMSLVKSQLDVSDASDTINPVYIIICK